MNLQRLETNFAPATARIFALFWGGVLVLIAPAKGYAQSAYTAAQLQVPGDPILYAFWGIGDISSGGAVGGMRRISNDITQRVDEPVVWNSDGSYQVLPVTGDYVQSYVNGFAGWDRPVGNVRFTFNSTDLPRPAIWEASGFQVLPSPTSFGQAVSGTGEYIAGFSLGDGIKAIYWDNAGVYTIAGLEGRVSQAFAVNADGWYVGPSYINGVPNTRAGFIGRGGTSKLLVHPDFPNTLAFDINDNNWVIGESRPTNPQQPSQVIAQLPYVWHDDQFTALGLFPGLTAAAAYSINNDNTIVGSASMYGEDVVKAIAWFNGSTTPTDLNTLVNIPGATLINAMGNNNAGQIFAEARLNDGSGYRYYVLTPIPEPAIAGVALLALVGSMNRRCRC